MYQPAAIKRLVVPNTASKHWRQMREPLLDAYRTTKDMVVPQYRQPDTQLRRTWDSAVVEAAGAARSEVDEWRRLITDEPFVAGRTYIERPVDD